MIKLALIAGLTTVLLTVADAGEIGVGVGFGRSSQPYRDALRLLKDKGFKSLKSWSVNPDWLDAVQDVYGGEAKVTVAVPNSDLWKVNGDQGYLDWVLGQLDKHRGLINFVAMGNEPFHEANRGEAMPHLLNAFNRMVQVVAERGLQNDIKVTVPFSSVVLTNTYPVESTVFHPEIIDTIRSLAPTMMATGSKFSINLYPFFAYSYSSGDISLNFALGRDGSLFEAMLRGCRVALDKIGANSLPMIVGETGWPSAGGKDTTTETEQAYTEHMINFASQSNLADTIYIFEAFDESEKPGEQTERHFGLYDEGRNEKFGFDIGGGGGGGDHPCTEWGWKFYDGFDIVGNDIGNAPAGHRNDCQEPCRSRGGCVGYSWFDSVCYFKSGSSSIKSASGVYSAIIC